MTSSSSGVKFNFDYPDNMQKPLSLSIVALYTNIYPEDSKTIDKGSLESCMIPLVFHTCVCSTWLHALTMHTNIHVMHMLYVGNYNKDYAATYHSQQSIKAAFSE